MNLHPTRLAEAGEAGRLHLYCADAYVDDKGWVRHAVHHYRMHYYACARRWGLLPADEHKLEPVEMIGG